MALWLVRAGKYGEHEPRFFEDNRIYLTWDNLTDSDMTGLLNYEGVRGLMQQKYPGEPARRIGNWTGQIWAFVLAMKPGNLVVVPRKSTGSVAIGEISSGYTYDPNAEPMYRHYRTVKWLKTDVPRTSFDQDLLYSLGAIMTICEIKRNDAEKRIRTLIQHKLLTVTPAPVPTGTDIQPITPLSEDAEVDLEQLARDAIAKIIIQKFKGHGMARLVEAVLKAQGFTTHLSPEGPDGGLDILAGSGAFGFDRPRICVQVKSGDTPAGSPEFNQLIGVMQNVSADQGLFVSWSGFKSSVAKEIPKQFFKVRVWNQDDLIEQLLANYEKLDPDIRAELPFKRIWTLAMPEE